MKRKNWLQRHPHLLEYSYRLAGLLVRMAHPLIRLVGYERVDRWISPIERAVKQNLFGCAMCGQCVLRSTGMICPMTCPKQLRNGACGGVRGNGHCEVIPEMKCVWVEAYERACVLTEFGPEIINIKPPVNHRLEGSSAWINMLLRTDTKAPVGWLEAPHNRVIERKLVRN